MAAGEQIREEPGSSTLNFKLLKLKSVTQLGVSNAFL